MDDTSEDVYSLLD